MLEQNKLQTAQKSLQNLKTTNKNIQINMSTLSSAQKQMCLKLLASSNINFEEDRNLNCFEAQLRIDPAKLTQEFDGGEKQVQQEPKVSPIKKRVSGTKQQKQTYGNAKQNMAISGNKKKQANKQQSSKPTQPTKPQATKQPITNHAIYTNSRKPLNKTVKINTLTQIQKIHPYIQLYIYPKKMSFQSLIQLIQEVYELYWVVEIQGKVNKGRRQVVSKIVEQNEGKMKRQTPNNMNENFNNTKENNRIKTNTNNKPAYRQTISEKQLSNQSNINNKTTQLNIQQIQSKQSFAQWVYENFIIVYKQKMKAEQLLVNLIESLNHFSFKHMGIQMFVNFLSGAYSLDVLNYFLVIRALLEQLTGEKIIDKVSSYGSRAGVVYKMKLNPYMKQIQQERVYDFLQVCFQGSKQQPIIDQIFQQMTQRMFFDQKRRKNFIHYFDMVDILLKQFLKVQTMNNTTNLQLSVTQTHEQSQQFGQLLSYENVGNGGNNDQHEMELTFQVKQPQQIINQQELQLDHYLPNNNNNTQQEIQDDYRILSQSLSKSLQKDEKFQFYDMVVEKIHLKYQALCRSFCIQLSNSQQLSQTKQSKIILDTLIQAVMRHDKKAWIDLLKSMSKIKPQRQAQQLHFIQQLQKQYQQIKNSNFISNQFIKKILTASYLRQAILMEVGISLKTL